VHLALGVSPARLMRAMVTETLLLGVSGGVLAVLLSTWGDAFLRATLLKDMPWNGEVVDARQGVFVALLVLLSALTAGSLPAFVASRTTVLDALKSGVREGGGRRHSARDARPAGNPPVVLMIGAGLFVRSFASCQRRPRIRCRSADSCHAELGESVNSPEEFEAHWLRMEERVRRLPGVVAVAQSVTVPFESQWTYSVLLNGDTLPPIKGGGPYLNGISTDYFRALQTPVIRGRDFSDTDRKGSMPVAIVNERMAAVLWPNVEPIGQCFGVQEFDGCMTVVGVVPDARMTEMTEDAPAQYYLPIGQWSPNMRALMVRRSLEGESANWTFGARYSTPSRRFPFVEVRPASMILEQQLRA
jgi:hypothetical protein